MTRTMGNGMSRLFHTGYWTNVTRSIRARIPSPPRRTYAGSMPFLPNPFYFMIVEWIVRAGTPLVIRRFSRPLLMEILFEGDATFERGSGAVAGLLAITRTHLLFTPRGAWARGPVLQLPLDEIEEVTPVTRRLLGLVPLASNVIKIRSRRGIFRFTVDRSDRDRWLREIEAAASM